MLFYINLKLKFGIKFIGGTVAWENEHGVVFSYLISCIFIFGMLNCVTI